MRREEVAMDDILFTAEIRDGLYHSGVAHDDDPPGRGSGRYGWGTGENPGQHQFDFLSEVKTLKKRGLKDAEIAKMLLGPKGHMKDGSPIWSNSTDLRAQIAIERTNDRKRKMARATELYDKYNGNVSAVGREMGINESSVRSLLNPVIAMRTSKYEDTANMLRKKVEEKGMIDVSKATEYTLGCTASTKKTALSMLEKEGYVTVKVSIPQPGRKDQNTNILALVKPLPGETPKETFVRVQKNKFDIQPIEDYTPDQGITWWTPEFPSSLDSKRIMIRYGEEGGKEKDGVIEINPKAKDLSLEGSLYAQVRIAVDGTNYMKGMAMYGSEKEFPKGVDVIYNTNKKAGTPAIDTNAVYNPDNDTWSGKEVLKRLKINQTTMEVDKDNPFGATIKAPKERDGVVTRGGQHYYTDSDGKEKLSPINKVREEGEWDTWSKNLSSQFLSKQPIKLIKQQIDLSVSERKMELDEIRRLTNQVIKKKLLEDFANNCDANAVDLSVKGVKNQAFQVILPITSMKDNETYAPKYDDGDIVALIRYPHAGPFEIPVLKVNNKQPEAKMRMKNATDAVGINEKVAAQLSGADFDGDTVVVIPLASNRLSVKAKPYFKELENFDPKELYKLPDDAPKMVNRTKQIQMGITTNLIADMTAQGATDKELVRAVKHSMVVIDAEKHHLDYKLSEKVNDIKSLKDKYQKRIDLDTGKESTGASTIFSRAKNPTYINKVREITDTSKMTPSELERWNEGKKVYRETGEYVKKRITDPSEMTPSEIDLYNSGKKVYRESDKHVQMKVKRMEITDNAMDLVRDQSNPKEVAYAEYANELKRMANEARKEARSIKPYKISTEAKKTYASEVKSLERKLRVAQSNNPRERRATMIANSLMSEKMKSNPDMDYEHKQRAEAQCMTIARGMVGAKKEMVVITDKEWEAIQANAISSTKLSEILNNTDQEAFKKRATPRSNSKDLTNAQLTRIKAMINSGMYTQKEIADSLGISASTISNVMING